MSKPKVDINKLSEQSYELYSLIDRTNILLEDPTPISELREGFEEKVSNLGPEVWEYAKYAFLATRKNPRAMVPMAVAIAAATAVGWVGAASIDAVRNGVAKSEAKKALLGYYEQLASKQSMIIEEQQRINREMTAAIEDLSQNEAEYRAKIQALQKRQTELGELLQRFNNLKMHVEK